MHVNSMKSDQAPVMSGVTCQRFWYLVVLLAHQRHLRRLAQKDIDSKNFIIFDRWHSNTVSVRRI